MAAGLALVVERARLTPHDRRGLVEFELAAALCRTREEDGHPLLTCAQ